MRNGRKLVHFRAGKRDLAGRQHRAARHAFAACQWEPAEGQRKEIADSGAAGPGGRAKAIDSVGDAHATRTSVEVVRSAYRIASEGFALPYGDIAVGHWRNIQ